MTRQPQDIERLFPVLAGSGDLLEVARCGVEIEHQLINLPVVATIISGMKQRAKIAIGDLLKMDMADPDWTAAAKTRIGEILSYQNAINDVVAQVLAGWNATEVIERNEHRG